MFPHGPLRTPRRTACVAALAALSALAAPVLATAAFAEDAAPDRLLEQKVETIVTVKMVMKIHFQGGGNSSDREDTSTCRGAVVDPAGLVMLSNDSAGGDSTGLTKSILRQFFGPNAEVRATPVDVRITFGDEGKEYPAVLVARDTNLNLAYVQVVDLEGRKIAAVDFAHGPDLKAGQPLLLPTRKSRGFDCAPILERVYPSMHVEKPRPMWQMSGDIVDIGIPAYDKVGQFAGVLVQQAGSEGSATAAGEVETGVFLLPPDAVEKSLAAAKAQVPQALAKAKEGAAKEPEPKAEAPKTPDTPK